MDTPDTPLPQYDALYRLWEVFLHMRAWGVPEYGDLPEDAREGFAEAVATGALFTYVEDCKRDVLRAEIDLPDEWLSVLYAAHVSPDVPLPQAERDHLGRILTAMYPMLCRLDPDATPGGEPAASGESEPRPEAGDAGRLDVPIVDRHDDRVVWWIGRRLYLGRDTQIARLFWLLAKPVGRAHTLGQVQRAVDGMETSAHVGSGPEDIAKAGKRMRKVVSKLRAAMRESGLDTHFVIHRGGSQSEPEYSLISRFGAKK